MTDKLKAYYIGTVKMELHFDNGRHFGIEEPIPEIWRFSDGTQAKMSALLGVLQRLVEQTRNPWEEQG
jgi:hypothetical protein